MLEHERQEHDSLTHCCPHTDSRAAADKNYIIPLWDLIKDDQKETGQVWVSVCVCIIVRLLGTSVFVREYIPESTHCDGKQKTTDAIFSFFPELYLEVKLFFPINHFQSIQSRKKPVQRNEAFFVKSENKSCLHAEQRDDYQADIVWATCQHYTVKTQISSPLKSLSDTSA